MSFRIDKAERRRDGQRAEPSVGAEVAGRDRRDEAQQILDPLVRPYGAHQSADRRIPIVESRGDVITRPRGAQHRTPGIDHNRLRGAVPDREIRRIVAGIDKTAFPEASPQRLGLQSAAQICLSIACDHLVEQVEVFRNPLGDGTIRRGAQHQMTSGFVLSADVLQEVGVVRQRRRVKSPALGQFRLQLGFALGKPARKPEQDSPVSESGREGAFLKRVDVQQRSIQIDA